MAAWYFSLVFSLGVCVLTGLIPNWGQWYSRDLAYRRQTDALLQGHIALSSSPRDLGFDLVWAKGGVQQVWGLAVPLWRLPFEAAARLVGQSGFPDRVSFAVALIILSYLLFRVFLFSDNKQNALDFVGNLKKEPERVASVVLLILFPPFLTLCSGPFKVYEEAEAYSYLYSVGLFACTLVFYYRQRFSHYVLISFLSGFSLFVRPTMGAYGFASLFVGFCISRRTKWNWWKSLFGIELFLFVIGLLLLTDFFRFGSCFEFGHRLNLTVMELEYASRFDAPFHHEPFWSAFRELFGALFLVQHPTGCATNAKEIFTWQSHTIRWRHFYHTTFDFSFLLALLTCWGLALWYSKDTRRKSKKCAQSGVLTLSAVWSFVSIIPLTGFYLHFHAICSRYIMDFMPAFSVAIVGIIRSVFYLQRDRQRKAVRISLLLLLCIWWGWQMSTEKTTPGSLPCTNSEVKELSFQSIANGKWRQLPQYYSFGTNLLETYGIPWNGDGWLLDGSTKPVVTLFIRNPEQLVLNVAPVDGANVTERDYSWIKARVGLEALHLQSIKKTKEGRQLIFKGPCSKIYKTGIQVVFISFVPTNEMLAKTSPFKLLRVSWKESKTD